MAHNPVVQDYLGEVGLSQLLRAAVETAPDKGLPLLHAKVIAVFKAAVNLHATNQERVAKMLVDLLKGDQTTEFCIELAIGLLSYIDLIYVSLSSSLDAVTMASLSRPHFGTSGGSNPIGQSQRDPVPLSLGEPSVPTCAFVFLTSPEEPAPSGTSAPCWRST